MTTKEHIKMRITFLAISILAISLIAACTTTPATSGAQQSLCKIDPTTGQCAGYLVPEDEAASTAWDGGASSIDNSGCQRPGATSKDCWVEFTLPLVGTKHVICRCEGCDGSTCRYCACEIGDGGIRQ